MHRSRLPLLVIATAVAACATRDDSDNTKTLSRDSTLAAHVESSQNTGQKADRLPLPDTCGAVAIPDSPAPAEKAEAAKLARQAYDAEVLGNIREAGALLRRASKLDWLDKSSAYHLGRVDEQLGEGADAIKAYCRFMALAPTKAEQLDASQRVAKLSESQTQTRLAGATRGANDSLTSSRRVAVPTAQRGARRNAAIEQPKVIARTRVAESAPAPSRERGSRRSTSMAAGSVDLPTSNERATAPRASTEKTDSVVTASDGDAMRPAPTVDQPTTASPVERRGSSRAQGAGIGAVAGAIIGGIAGRSVTAAAIGAAAGGVLGAAAGRGRRAPTGGIQF